MFTFAVQTTNDMKQIGIILAWVILYAIPIKADNFESATQAVANMAVGWNLGNTLDANNGKLQPDIVASETTWGQPVTQPALMAMMKNAGFGAIRVPVTWFPHLDSDGKVDAAWMQRVHEVVDYVIDQGLYCILNVHHDTGDDSGGGFTSWLKADMAVYGQQKARYEYLWQQIATEFRDYGERLLFESYNEMLDSYNSWCFASFATSSKYNATVAADAYQAINSYAQSFVNTVRATGGNNSQRNLVVNTYAASCGSGTWNSHLKDPLKQMALPQDNVEGHLLFQVHCYPNISSLSAAKAELNDMFSALRTHLVAKGAPVVIGEWGTSDSGDDYLNNRENMKAFARYLVQTAKTYGMATVYWMGLSDGVARSLPAFNQPDLAETIVKAWRGDDYQGQFLTEDDYDITYTVNFTKQWGEMNLCDHKLLLSNYKGLKVELDPAPASNQLQVKCYGESKDLYVKVNGATTTVTFGSSLGTYVDRVTLQQMQTDPYSVVVHRIALIKSDGTEQEVRPTVFWGCDITLDSHLKTVIVPVEYHAKTESARYNLAGLRVDATYKGLVIDNGKKLLVR